MGLIPFMENITGVVDIYLFYSDNNGYSVFKLEDGTSVVGNLPKLNEGDRVELSGEWVEHPRYGKQFKVESDAEGADGYVEGKLLVELKTHTEDWLKGLYQGFRDEFT